MMNEVLFFRAVLQPGESIVPSGWYWPREYRVEWRDLDDGAKEFSVYAQENNDE